MTRTPRTRVAAPVTSGWQLEAPRTKTTPAFIDAINADRDVSLVLHVGDIHSGNQYCSEAYDRTIFDMWTTFEDPLIYTQGDNEWTDCHKAAAGQSAEQHAPGLRRAELPPHRGPRQYAAARVAASDG